MRNYFGAIAVLILVITAAFSSQSRAQNVPSMMLTAATQTQPIKGACVMGVSKQVKNRLQFTHPIPVYRNETDAAPAGEMVYHDVYYVASDVTKSGRVKLVYAPGFDQHPEAGKVFGWVNRNDIQVFSKNNCE